MAVEGFHFDDTLIAGESLTTARYKAVKLSAAKTVVLCTGATDIPIGILQNNPASGGVAIVRLLGISKINGDALLAYGDLIGTSADGQLAAYVAGTDTTKYVIGRVRQINGAAGDYATAYINCLNPHRGA